MPYSVDVVANGNVWVADRGNHRIQEFDKNTSLRITLSHGIPTWFCGGPAEGEYVGIAPVKSMKSKNRLSLLFR